jgi:two-component system sensor histidine kinase TorS
MVVVGLVSFGVNRFLAQTQQRVLSDSIAIIERTERVAQDADFAVSLAGQLAAAREARQAEDLSRALGLRVDGIATDLAAMRAFLGRASGPGSAEAVRGVVAEMDRTVAALIDATAGAVAGRVALSEAGTRLAKLISTETDLARLRVTANIWELYRLPDSAAARAGLDRLADVNFFAYERLAEMAEAVSTLDRLVDLIGAAGAVADLDALAMDYAAAVSLLRDRVPFMLSARSREVASEIVAEFELGLSGEGLLAQRRAALQAQGALNVLSADLDGRLDLLIDEARQGRVETREQMQAGVVAAGWQATLLSTALAGVILLALLAGYMVWARIRRRVVLRLEDVADRMVAVAGGDLGEAVPISGADEIGRLEAALNVLRDRAEEAGRLRGRLEAAVIDRTAEVVAEMQSANAARADAEEQSRAKTHFLARMSHEIRTPLNGLIGILDLLAADETDAARRARLEVALTSARDLQELTEEILTFSVGEEGQNQTRLSVFDPSGLAQGLAAHLGVIAADKGLQALVQIDPALPPAMIGEPAKIRQVMVNLLSNAVKYTRRGSVALTVAARSIAAGTHELSLGVRDTGPGMTEEETRQAFDIYGRSRTARQSGVTGVGLGLAIVRQLTDAMGAELRVSTAPGRGSSFTLVLQLPEADPAGISVAQPFPPSGAGGRVLVVDDHPVNRLVARGYLERMGCSVTEAATGHAALVAAREGAFDAILVDIGLPDLAGEVVIAQLPRKGARVAVLTADLVRDDDETRRRFGVDRVLTKPISPRELAAFLDMGEPSAALPVQASAAPSLEAALREDIAGLGAAQTAEIVAALMEDLAAAGPQLRDAPDAETRRKLAHRLKGAASNFRLEAFSALMQRLQSDDLSALETLESVASATIRDLEEAAHRVGLTLQREAEAAKQ